MDRNSNIDRRDSVIDALRTIGTMLIILAHVSIPEWLSHIRCFDVVLLCFISGMCINISDFTHYIPYLKKRFKRLVIPAWGFLLLLFSLTAVVCCLFNRSQLYSPGQIMQSFLFLDGGIGFIWIVRVYVFIAVIAVPMIVLLKKTRINWIAYVFVLVFFALTSIVNLFSKTNSIWMNYFLEAVVYSCIAILGFLYNDGKRREKRNRFDLISICFFPSIIVVILLSNKYGFIPDSFKYPPRLFYIAYGLVVTYSLLLVFVCFFDMEKIPQRWSIVIRWVSTHSYNIYLWHILSLTVLNFSEDLLGIQIHLLFEYTFVLVVSLVITFFVDKLKHMVSRLLTKWTAKE